MTTTSTGRPGDEEHRGFLSPLLAELRANPDVRIVPCTDQLLQEGIDLFAQRPDKEWSLTDCISFVVMNIFLFEVIGNNSDQTLNPERELFETTFSSSRGFDIGADQRLHLVLTNPREFKTALDEDWPSAREILAAIRWGDYKVLHADATGKRMLGMIRAKLGPRRKASRGCSAGLDKPKPIRLAGR